MLITHLKLINHTLSIKLGLPFRQRYTHTKREIHVFKINIWSGRTLRPERYRNLFKVCWKSTPDWFRDGWASDFNDMFILFVKMQMKSHSKLGSKHQQKLFWRPFFSCIYKHCWIYLFYDLICFCLADYGHGVSKVWCIWSKKKTICCYFVIESDKNPKKC